MKEKNPRIKLIGIGGGAGSILEYIYRNHTSLMDLIYIDSDAEAIENSIIPTKLMIEEYYNSSEKQFSIVQKGFKTTYHSLFDISGFIDSNTEFVILLTCLGGSLGSSAIPVISTTLKDMGITSLELMTMPFSFEGQRRSRIANEALISIEKVSDSFVIIENDKAINLIGSSVKEELFPVIDNYISSIIKIFPKIISVSGYINVDIDDVKAVVKGKGELFIGVGSGYGKDRVNKALKSLFNYPLTKNNRIINATDCLLFIDGNPNISMDEITEITDSVIDRTGPNTDVIWGSSYSESKDDILTLAFVASGFPKKERNSFFDTDEMQFLMQTTTNQNISENNEDDISLYFLESEYDSKEIAEIISSLSELYKGIGGDEIVIKGTDVFNISEILQPVLK